MKRYIVPKIKYVELRAEEKIANTCTGSCDDATAAQWNAEENTDYYVGFGS